MGPELREFLLPVSGVHVRLKLDLPSEGDVQDECGETVCIQSLCSLGLAAVTREVALSSCS